MHDQVPAPRVVPLLQGPLAGALFMVLAAFIFAAMNVLVREASQELSPLQVAFFRNLFALIAMLPWLMSKGLHGLKTDQLGLHLIRAIVGILGMFTWFTAISLLPMAQAVALNFTIPLFAIAGAALILREQVGPRRWGATLVGFLGTVIILRPGFEAIELVSLLPILAAVFMATSSLLVKTLTRREDPNAMVFYMNLFMTPLSLVPALFFWSWPSPLVWVEVIALGLIAAVAHIFLNRAFKAADASAILPLDYTRLPFVALFGFLLYGEVPDLWTWIGGGVIAAAAIYIARREAQLRRSLAALKPTSERG